jgi:hypothetical protein
VAAVRVSAEKAIVPIPIQLSTDIQRDGSRRSRGTARARRPPTASSQARVGSEKKAQGSLARVSQIEKASEQAARRLMATTMAENNGWAFRVEVERIRPGRRHQTREATKRSAGHTR